MRGNESRAGSTSPKRRPDGASDYELILDTVAVHHLEKLPHNIRARIMDRLHESAKSPNRFFKRLQGRPECSLRVGDYRVIADIDGQSIVVLYVAHRRNVYDRS